MALTSQRIFKNLAEYRLEDMPERIYQRLMLGFFIVAIASQFSLAWQNPKIKVLRICLSFCGVVAGVNLIQSTRTPSKLEKEIEELNRQKQQQALTIEQERQALDLERQNLYGEIEAIEAKMQQWADSQLQEWEQQHQGEISRLHEEWLFEKEMLLGQLNQLQSSLYDLTRIKTADTSSRVGWLAQKIQSELRENFDILTSCETEPVEAGDRFLIWLTPRGDKPTLKRLRELAEELPLRIKEIKSVPTIELDPENSAIKLEIPKAREKEAKEELIKLYPWEQAKEEASGMIVTGNTGAGKTAVASWLLGLLTEDSPKQIIVLDIHAKKNYWHEFNLPVVYQQEKIILALELILGELNRRKITGDESPELIVVLDEIAALKINCGDKEQREWINNALLLIGAEGRKFGVHLIALNQSKNVASLGIDSQNRNNYLLILLNAASRDWADNTWGKTDERNSYIHSQPYSCIVSGCVSTQVATHPTHGTYKKFKIKGAKPKNLKPINWLFPTINGLDKLVIGGGASTVLTPNEPNEPLNGDSLTPLPCISSPHEPEAKSKITLPPESEFLPLPPEESPEAKQRILDCMEREMNQTETIKELWGLKRGSSKNYLRARDIYKLVKNSNTA